MGGAGRGGGTWLTYFGCFCCCFLFPVVVVVVFIFLYFFLLLFFSHAIDCDSMRLPCGRYRVLMGMESLDFTALSLPAGDTILHLAVKLGGKAGMELLKVCL